MVMCTKLLPRPQFEVLLAILMLFRTNTNIWIIIYVLNTWKIVYTVTWTWQSDIYFYSTLLFAYVSNICYITRTHFQNIHVHILRASICEFNFTWPKLAESNDAPGQPRKQPKLIKLVSLNSIWNFHIIIFENIFILCLMHKKFKTLTNKLRSENNIINLVTSFRSNDTK